ncbi:MAG: hypothetical protein RR441_11780, partial [Longicatena sp.]
MKSIFKYELLGKVDFGNEIECILKLNGITDIDGFLNPNPQAVENPHAFKNIDKAASLLLC